MDEAVTKPAADKPEESLPISIKVKWIDGLRFVASDYKGHSIIMDVSEEHGGEGSGFGPMQLLLAAFGGCTGIDVIEILRKQRQKPEGLEIMVSGERVSEPPRVYSKVHVEYRVKGKGFKEKALKRAIQLSQDKYCSVGTTLKAKGEVTYNHIMQQI